MEAVNSLMPSWLQAVAYGNPLTYMVDALRSLMVFGAPSEFGIVVDMLVLIGITGALVLIAARLYPRVAQ